ncbi:SusD family protein [Zhouia amylolytica]|uniref:SusD family protein n=1 Tax=Zhouia amylolytica TaxID=376730 RepID=A0A1I6VG62_9FLAO|nr:RagB/SusD family nutrient uptake outer membrane protein [Zhouia amylolytica]SFT12736.1 SusD family protein [Zhouia amylolytica]
MKKLFLIIPIILLTFSCSDFLDEVDQDKLVPEKTDHYAAMLLQEFNWNYPIFLTVDHMTDNIVENPEALSSQKFSSKTTYTWQREIEIDEDGNENNSVNQTWGNIYEDIAISNYVIELIDDALGNQSEIDFVKGEAYFIRAFSYFNLLNLYGQPYNSSSADVALGIPVRDNIGVEEVYSRNTVNECYSQIEADLMSAIELITMSGIEKSIWHPNIAACNLLMSRVKLYQEKWDEAIDYSNKVIAEASLSRISVNVPFITEDNSELLYSYSTLRPLFGGDTEPYIANKELIDLYDDNDIRKEAFFTAIDNGTGKLYYMPRKYQRDTYTSLGYANFRVSEAYLNRAEAYAQKQDVENALNDIRSLHSARYSDASSVVYPGESSEVLAYVLQERRKELCFEDHHRWFDLRRMKNRPEIKHVYSLIEDNGTKLGTETYTLLPDDLNYTLPIPLKERQNNPLIRNNERYEKIPEINNEVIID